MALTANSSQSGAKTTVLVAVIVLHIALFYAIQSGLTRKVIELLPQDIQTNLIEKEKPKEDLPPPPPPPDIPIEPPPFVPPPEVSIASAPVATNTITNVVTTPPPAPPPPVAAPRQVVVVPPKTDPKKSRSCDEYYPAAASRAGEEGIVQVHCLVGLNGKCDQISIAKSSGIQRLDEAAQRCAKDLLRFSPATKDGVAEATWYDFNVRFTVKK